MATDSPAPATPTLTADGLDSVLDRTAGQRILRHFAVFIACGYLAYLILTLPAIIASFRVMHPAWTFPALIVVFGPGIALGPWAWRAPARRLKVAAALAAAGYIAAVATWRLGWTGDHLNGNTDIWFWLFNGLAGIAAALAMRPAYAFVVLVGIVVASTTINHAIRASATNGPLLPDIAWSFAFCLVFFSAAVMGMRTAAVLDDTRAYAYAATSEAAATQARTAERQRFNQLTHDGVMSTLLVAARQGNSTQLARQAQATLSDLDVLRDGAPHSEPLPVQAAIAHIRTTLTTADHQLRFHAIEDGQAPRRLPAAAIRTVAAAAAEAVRNSMRHAASTTPTAAAIVIDGTTLEITITDEGAGFDPESVPPDRLGLAVSVRDRMAQIGGSATIDSTPGQGTRIHLRWAHHQ